MIYLLVSHSAHLNGAEISLVELARILRARDRCEVHVLLPSRTTDSEIEPALLDLGCRVHRLPYLDTHWVAPRFRPFHLSWQTLAMVPRLLRLYRRMRPEVVVLNTIVINPVFAILARAASIPVVWWIHELGMKAHGLRFFIGKPTTIAVIRRIATTLVFPSTYCRDACLRAGSAHTHVIAPVFDVSSAASPPAGRGALRESRTWSVVIVGRTTEGKGQRDAILALDILVNVMKRTDLRATVVGTVDNPYTREMRATATRLHLDAYITWEPFVEPHRVGQYLRQADIGLVTSRHEAFGRVTVEYLLAGLITVGADEGGTAEILREFPDSAFRYRTGDPGDLAKVIDSVTRRPRSFYRIALEEQVATASTMYSDERTHRLWTQVFRAVGARPRHSVS